MRFVLCASLVAGLPAGAASPAPQARLQETVRVALCQMSVADGDVRGNLAKIESQVQQAAAQGARLCVFPELADVGFGPIVKASTGGEHARPIPGETTDALGRMAATARVWIAIALLEQVATHRFGWRPSGLRPSGHSLSALTCHPRWAKWKLSRGKASPPTIS